MISINDNIHNPSQPKSDENLLVYDPTQPFDQIAFQRPPFIFPVGWYRKHTLPEKTYPLKRESLQKMLDLYYIFDQQGICYPAKGPLYLQQKSANKDIE